MVNNELFRLDGRIDLSILHLILIWSQVECTIHRPRSLKILNAHVVFKGHDIGMRLDQYHWFPFFLVMDIALLLRDLQHWWNVFDLGHPTLTKDFLLFHPHIDCVALFWGLTLLFYLEPVGDLAESWGANLRSWVESVGFVLALLSGLGVEGGQHLVSRFFLCHPHAIPRILK